jgi:hypothetical protein
LKQLVVQDPSRSTPSLPVPIRASNSTLRAARVLASLCHIQAVQVSQKARQSNSGSVVVGLFHQGGSRIIPRGDLLSWLREHDGMSNQSVNGHSDNSPCARSQAQVSLAGAAQSGGSSSSGSLAQISACSGVSPKARGGNHGTCTRSMARRAAGSLSVAPVAFAGMHSRPRESAVQRSRPSSATGSSSCGLACVASSSNSGSSMRQGLQTMRGCSSAAQPHEVVSTSHKGLAGAVQRSVLQVPLDLRRASSLPCFSHLHARGESQRAHP